MRKREFSSSLFGNILPYFYFREFSQISIKQILQTGLYSSLLFTYFRSQSHEQTLKIAEKALHVYVCLTYRKFPNQNKLRGLYFSKALSQGPIFGGAYIRRGLCTEGNLRFKIDWASLVVGRTLAVFALFYFVFEGNFQVQAFVGAYIRRGDLTESFLPYRFTGLIFKGAYTWRGFFSEFYGM